MSGLLRPEREPDRFDAIPKVGVLAGRLHWYEGKLRRPTSKTLASFELSSGILTLTEAGSRRRASLHVVQGEAGLRALDPGGEDVFAMTVDRFGQILRSANHTLKRALTDPRLLSGIGNAYSDEILFQARLSPLLEPWTRRHATRVPRAAA
jgi:formamidopyrimidine-DNA glycosylase